MFANGDDVRTVILRKACRNKLLDAVFGGEDEYADTSSTDTSDADASYTDTSTNTGSNEMESLNETYTGGTESYENYGAAANEMETMNAAYSGTDGWSVPQEGVVPQNEMETLNAAFTQPGTEPVPAPGVIPQEGVVPQNEMETLNDAFTGDQTPRDQPATDTPPDPLASVNLAQHNLSEQQLATLRDHLAGRPVDDGALNNIPNNVWADLEAQRQGGSLELAADRTPSPALPGSPYHPDQVQQRVLPPYDPVHERDGYKANPNKTPEPPDARRVYEQGRDQGRLFRANTGTYFGVGDRGEIYRYQTSQSGPDGQMRSHFNGVVPVNHPDIPNELRRQVGNTAFQRAFRYGLGRGPARGAE